MRKQVGSTLIILSLFLIVILSAVSSVHAGLKLDTALVSLTIDDGHKDTVLNAYPILKSFNITATSYVITSAVGQPDFMNLSEIQELQRAGWEIGSHSCSHPHMTMISSDHASHELNDSKNWLVARGINVTSFAFPYGAENSNLTRLASNMYEITRGTSNDSYFYQTIPENRLLIGVNLPLNNNLTFSYIDRAIEEKSWIVFYFHRVDASGHVVGTGQDIREIAAYIQKKVQMGELKAVTITQGSRGLVLELNENIQYREMKMNSGILLEMRPRDDHG